MTARRREGAIAREEFESMSLWLPNVRAIPSQQPERIRQVRALYAHFRRMADALAEIAVIENCNAGHSSEVRQLATIARAALPEGWETK
jgi:hypothetical protein